VYGLDFYELGITANIVARLIIIIMCLGAPGGSKGPPVSHGGLMAWGGGEARRPPVRYAYSKSRIVAARFSTSRSDRLLSSGGADVDDGGDDDSQQWLDYQWQKKLERRIHSSRGDVFMNRKTNGINYIPSPMDLHDHQNRYYPGVTHVPYNNRNRRPSSRR
jgi:hypothetical protein